MEKNIYLDYAATTYVKEEVLQKMLPYFSEKFGNPSSIYKAGQENKKVVEEAREKVAKALNAEPDEIFFTSCGSESDNWAIKGIANANRKKGNHIITTKIEHHAILNTCKFLEQNGFNVTYLKVNNEGLVDIEELKKAIKETTILISVMFANNEIGTIEPIEEIGKIAKENNIYFHTDAVQAIGNIKIDVKKLNIDMLSMSAHKFYGPKGIGALYIKRGTQIDNLIHGGGQEQKRRAGTENVAEIVGLGEAIRLSYDKFDAYNSKLINLRERLINRVINEIPNVKINGHRTMRLPGNVNFSFAGVEGEALLLMLNMKGIECSTASACSSGTSEPSHVLTAIGLDEALSHGSLRLTIGESTTKEDIDYVVDTLKETVAKLREIS